MLLQCSCDLFWRTQLKHEFSCKPLHGSNLNFSENFLSTIELDTLYCFIIFHISMFIDVLKSCTTFSVCFVFQFCWSSQVNRSKAEWKKDKNCIMCNEGSLLRTYFAAISKVMYLKISGYFFKFQILNKYIYSITIWVDTLRVRKREISIITLGSDVTLDRVLK